MFGITYIRKEAHDAAVAELRAALAVSDAKYEGLRVIADGLREDLREAHRQAHELRVLGAVTVPVPRPDGPPLPPVAHDALKALIAEKAGRNTELRGIMLRQLAADRAAGRSDEDIEQAIITGIVSDGVPV